MVGGRGLPLRVLPGVIGGTLMPLVKISLLDHWEGERLRRLNLGVHEALVEALGIESWDFFHRVDLYPPERFIFPEFKSRDFMIIEVHLFPGRTDDQKRLVHTCIWEHLKPLEVEAKDIFIQLVELPDLHWGVGGQVRG